MDKHNEQFTPEAVDELIDDLLESKLPTPPDEQIVQSLHRLYSEDAVTLDHVWQRLGLGKHTSFTDALQQAEISEERMRGQVRNIPYERNRRMFAEHQHQIGRSFMVIAALIIATLLIGSMLWLSHIVNPSSQVGASPAQTTLSQGSRQTDQQQTVQAPSGVYVGGNDGIARIDTQTGKLLWKYNYPKSMSNTGKLIAIGNTIYASIQSFSQGTQPAVLAIDIQTGKPLWSHLFANESLNDLTASNNILYVGTQNSIYALDAINGTQRAIYKMNGGEVQTLSASNGTLFIGASNGLHAFSLSNGKQIWYTAANGNQVYITTPHIVNNVLYTTINNVSELGGKSTATVAAFKTSTGEKLWQSDTIQSQVFDITVANNKVFVGTMTATTPFKGGLRAYDAQSGKLLWNTALDGAVEWAPTIDNGVVYVSAYAELFKPEEVAALNIADGSVKWKVKVTAGIMTTPEVVNGVVYISTGDNKNSGTTTALKATDGSQIWTASSPSPDTLLVVG
jgi:outer membrane protein assembly factor BamB